MLLLAGPVGAIPITIDPGPVGTTWNYGQFFFSDVPAVGFGGQTVPLDISFAGGKWLASSRIGVGLFLNQSGELGQWPNTAVTVTGYLVGNSGNPLSKPVPIDLTGYMPAQIWPGWPFYLPDGTPYLPATTIHEHRFEGDHISASSYRYFIDPLVVAGMHFDVTVPNSPSLGLIGGRMTLHNFDAPIYVSPHPIPPFPVNVPDAASTGLLLSLAVAALAVTRRIQAARHPALVPILRNAAARQVLNRDRGTSARAIPSIVKS